MIIKAKYKICRRLGTGIFEKCQTQKYVLSESKKSRLMGRGQGRRRPRSDFGSQLLEKQKVRYTYGVNEKQFSRYVKEAERSKGKSTSEKLIELLESRLDNVVYRLGLSLSRRHARQLVSHGHILVNGKIVSIPSYNVSIGDIIKVKESSLKKPLFEDLNERLKDNIPSSWLRFDENKKEAVVQGAPKVQDDLMFDLSAVLQFYSR